MTWETIVDELLETPCWIIDILPERVERDSQGQYFSIEKYYLEEPRLSAIKQKHINTILKLNCYRDITLDDESENNPSPNRIAEALRSRHLIIMMNDSMIVSEPDNTYLTLYNPDEELLRLMKHIAAGEGMFVWQ